jgi:hypothetical protein
LIGDRIELMRADDGRIIVQRYGAGLLCDWYFGVEADLVEGLSAWRDLPVVLWWSVAYLADHLRMHGFSTTGVDS